MTETALERRARLMGAHVPTLYAEPLHAVRAEGVWIWDDRGRKYLDAYNNTAHVGHANTRVMDAVHRQMRQCDTGTRYVDRVLLDYLDRLLATFPGPPRQVLMSCSGSEAVDVALRMAQAATGGLGIVATDDTYHGNTAAVSALSTRRPPLGGRPPHVRLVAAPRGTGPEDAATFAAEVDLAASDLARAGFGPASLILCPILANEGLMTAEFDLAPAAAAVRARGGVVICDEVQTGFARCSARWWAHEGRGLDPEIVTLGKAMANGLPAAAALATPEVMAAFRGAFGYFNTAAGTAVIAAAAGAVMDALERDDLAGNGRRVGYHLRSRLGAVEHPLVAGTRSAGLFAGVEIGGPNRGAAAAAVVDGMRARGVLVGAVGRDQHVVKIRPPMPVSRGNVELIVTALTEALDDAMAAA